MYLVGDLFELNLSFNIWFFVPNEVKKGNVFRVNVIKACGGRKYKTPLILNLSSKWTKWSPSLSGPFTPEKSDVFRVNVIKACGGRKYKTPLILNLSSKWTKWSPSLSGPFTPEKNPCRRGIGG